MWGRFSSRQALTTLPCRKCGQRVTVERSCHEVHVRCTSCGKQYPLQEYIQEADRAMEEFLENVYVDRM